MQDAQVTKSLEVTVLCPFKSQDILSAAALVFTGSTYEDRKSSQHDWKNVDCDVIKHQNKQSIVCAGIILKGLTCLLWHITTVTEKWILC